MWTLIMQDRHITDQEVASKLGVNTDFNIPLFKQGFSLATNVYKISANVTNGKKQNILIYGNSDPLNCEK